LPPSTIPPLSLFVIPPPLHPGTAPRLRPAYPSATTRLMTGAPQRYPATAPHPTNRSHPASPVTMWNAVLPANRAIIHPAAKRQTARPCGLVKQQGGPVTEGRIKRIDGTKLLLSSLIVLFVLPLAQLAYLAFFPTGPYVSDISAPVRYQTFFGASYLCLPALIAVLGAWYCSNRLGCFLLCLIAIGSVFSAIAFLWWRSGITDDYVDPQYRILHTVVQCKNHRVRVDGSITGYYLVEEWKILPVVSICRDLYHSNDEFSARPLSPVQIECRPLTGNPVVVNVSPCQ
jgi:hypothetical protein